jgi:serine/threonine protein kinase
MGCPDSEQLRQLTTGHLEQDEYVRVLGHLNTCVSCQQTIEALFVEGRIASVLASLSSGEQPPEGPELDRAISELKSLATIAPAEDGPDDEEDVLLDFLQPSENPEHLGYLDGYEVLEVIGQGGMGIVLKAHDPKLDRVVAIKVLSPALASVAGARERFLREARAAAAVNHEHVVAVHAVGETNRLPFLVMEYVNGRSLQDRIESEASLPLEDVLRIGLETASGLAAAHAHGLVHRDVKPANILLESGAQRVKITDFGLARAADDVHLTRSGVLAGTPQYMSPEQAGGKAVDARSDLFSLGSLMYAICTGRPPFDAESLVGSIRQVSEGAPPPIRQLNPDVPDWLTEIVEKLLAKDPERRFQSASEVADLLGRHLAHLQQPEAAPPPPRLSRSRRPRGWRVAAALLGVLLVLGVAEVTGMTNFAETLATILRIETPQGTLVVKITDPRVKVLVDADRGEIALSGVGDHELTLRPGRYQWQALQDGVAVERDWVTIERDGKKAVEVVLETPRASTNSIDLLQLIDPQRDSVSPSWNIDEQALVSSGDVSLLQIPFVPPEQYNLELEAERLAGVDCLSLGLVVGGQQATVALDAYAEEHGNLAGLFEIDGQRRVHNENSALGTVFPRGELTRVTVAVRKSGVSVASGGKTLFDWQGNPNRLSLRSLWSPRHPECLFVASYNSSFRITRLDLRPVSGEGRQLFTDEAPGDVDQVAAERALWRGGSVCVSVDDGPPLDVRRFRDLPASFRLLGVALRGRKQVTPADLASLKGLDRLERLDLANSSTRDEDLQHLPDLPSLAELDLSLARISDAGLADLPRRWPGLRRLILCGTAISDEGTNHIAGLMQLEELDVSGTQVSDTGLKAFKGSKSIKRLVLDHTAISDGGLVQLSELPGLEYVSFVGTEVSDAGLQHLRELEGLKGVCLFATRVSGEGIDDLRQRLPRCLVEGDPRQAVDLLSLVDPSRDAVRGKWYFEADALVSPEETYGRLQLTYAPPEEYVLELVAARRAGEDCLTVGVVAGGRQPLLIFDQGWDRGTGLGYIDGRRGHETEAARATRVFTRPEPVRVLIVVRRSHITAACAGRVLIDWRGDFQRLSHSPLWAVPDENSLFIGAFRSSFAISKLRLIPISGTGTVVPPGNRRE